jgi:hypothetical protein
MSIYMFATKIHLFSPESHWTFRLCNCSLVYSELTFHKISPETSDFPLGVRFVINIEIFVLKS